jgi:RNA polymerase sigma factor (sigma-70 family)
VLVPEDRERFERQILPHQDAAFNLARWLLRSRADAEDVTQEALVKAFRFFPGFHGGDARSWLLQIVRNTCYTWMEKYRSVDLTTEFDESVHMPGTATPETEAVASSASVARAGRLFVQRDCHDYFDADRDGDVHAGESAEEVAGIFARAGCGIRGKGSST